MTYPPTWKWETHGNILKCKYLGAFPHVGKGGRSVLYAIKDESGKTWTIWGVDAIRGKLQLLHPGKKVYLKFTGWKKTKKGFKARSFIIHIGKGEEKADPSNTRAAVKKRRTAAARHSTAPQALPRPVTPVGGAVAHASAAIRKKKIKKKPIRGVTAPPPKPPPGYGKGPKIIKYWEKAAVSG